MPVGPKVTPMTSNDATVSRLRDAVQQVMPSVRADLEALDIESVEVVKGAAAASLYGSRAASGVPGVIDEQLGLLRPGGTCREGDGDEEGKRAEETRKKRREQGKGTEKKKREKKLKKKVKKAANAVPNTVKQAVGAMIWSIPKAIWPCASPTKTSTSSTTSSTTPG